MKMNDILKKAKFTVNRTGLKLKKHSPEIMLAVGIVGVVGSTVLACRATLKVGDVIDKAKEDLNTLKEYEEAVENGKIDIAEDEREVKLEEVKHSKPAVYLKTSMTLAKLYAPAVGLGVLSIASICGSHRIMNKRVVGLSAALVTAERSFKEYRGRVVDRFGEDLDRELRFDIKKKEVDMTVVDENGKEEVTTQTVDVIDPTQISDYSRIWHEGNTGWTKDPVHNKWYLQKVEEMFTDKLRTEGHLFLNEVYHTLGFNKIPDGQMIGWVYDEKNPIGDNFVSFGIYNDIEDEAKRLFINGEERSVLLDFNHDGNILQYI
jgi:hypothetical protein